MKHTDPAYPAFMRVVTGSTGSVGAGAPAQPPDPSAAPARAPAPLQVGGGGNVPPLIHSNRGGGGQNPSKGFSPRTVTILALVFGFVAVVAQLIYWSNATDRDHAYNNTDAGKVDLAGRNEVMKLRAQTDFVRAQAELAQATGVVPTPVQDRPRVEPSNGAQFLATRKQEMIDRCGKRTEEMVYKPDPGCFYFDNSSGTSEKLVGVWSRTIVHSIMNEDDGKPNILITASDGSACASSAADSCTWWVRQHLSQEADGFYKFTVRVPKGQGFIANINTN